MNESHCRGNWGLCALGLALGLALVLSTFLMSGTIREIKSGNNVIEVSGFSQKKITSDLGVWRLSFWTRAPGLAEANNQLDGIRDTVESFLLEKGAKAEDLEYDPVAMRTLNEVDANGRPTNTIVAYHVSQDLQFTSADVDLVGRMARDASALIGMGIECSSHEPNFYYNKLDDVKIDMLTEAAANARLRAQKMAAENGSKIGALHFIHQGVFQITSPYSNEVSDYGVNDITSKEKTIKAVVTVRYAVKN